MVALKKLGDLKLPACFGALQLLLLDSPLLLEPSVSVHAVEEMNLCPPPCG